MGFQLSINQDTTPRLLPIFFFLAFLTTFKLWGFCLHCLQLRIWSKLKEKMLHFDFLVYMATSTIYDDRIPWKIFKGNTIVGANKKYNFMILVVVSDG